MKPNIIQQGDFFVESSKLASNSVDLIWGDPVYQNVEDYHKVALIAARVLKPGGSLILQSASYYRYQHETVMYEAAPDILTPRSMLIEIWPRQWLGTWRDLVTVGMRPYIWMGKKIGHKVARKGHWIPDHYMGGGKQKGMHDWGDSARFPERYIPSIVPAKGVVVDPFAGSGLITAICKKHHIKCYAWEIDPDICSTANINIHSKRYWQQDDYKTTKEAEGSRLLANYSTDRKTKP